MKRAVNKKPYLYFFLLVLRTYWARNPCSAWCNKKQRSPCRKYRYNYYLNIVILAIFSQEKRNIYDCLWEAEKNVIFLMAVLPFFAASLVYSANPKIWGEGEGQTYLATPAGKAFHTNAIIFKIYFCPFQFFFFFGTKYKLNGF